MSWNVVAVALKNTVWSEIVRNWDTWQETAEVLATFPLQLDTEVQNGYSTGYVQRLWILESHKAIYSYAGVAIITSRT